MSDGAGLADPVTFDAGRCWAGLCDISPAQPVPLAGYAGKERLCQADAGGLEANWLAFPADKDAIALILAVDALFSSDAFEAAVSEALGRGGVRVSALWVIASHTHFAPQLDPTKPRLGRCVPGHLQDVAGRITASILGALATGPAGIAGIRHGSAPAPGAVHRRRAGWKLLRHPPFFRRMAIPAPAPEVPISRDLRLWVLHDGQGAPRAAIVHWSCHTVAAHPRDRVSPTHVGAIRDALRAEFAQPVPVIAMTGCSGDIRPDFRAPLLSRRTLAPYPFQPGFAPPTPDRIAPFEAAIAAATRRAAAGTTALPPAEGGALSRADAELLDGVVLAVTRLRIGPLTLLGLNCEPSHDWVTQLGFDHHAPDLAVTGYVGEVFGYLPTVEQIPYNGNEVEDFRFAFGFKHRWSECVDLSEQVGETMKKVMNL